MIPVPGVICITILFVVFTYLCTTGGIDNRWKRAASEKNLRLCEGKLYRVTSTDILYFHKNHGMYQTDSMIEWRNNNKAGFVKISEDNDIHGVIVDKPTDTSNPVYKGCKVKLSKHNRVIWEVVEWTGIRKGRLVLLVKDTGERG